MCLWTALRGDQAGAACQPTPTPPHTPPPTLPPHHTPLGSMVGMGPGTHGHHDRWGRQGVGMHRGWAWAGGRQTEGLVLALGMVHTLPSCGACHLYPSTPSLPFSHRIFSASFLQHTFHYPASLHTACTSATVLPTSLRLFSVLHTATAPPFILHCISVHFVTASASRMVHSSMHACCTTTVCRTCLHCSCILSSFLACLPCGGSVAPATSAARTAHALLFSCTAPCTTTTTPRTALHYTPRPPLDGRWAADRRAA